MPLRDLPIAQQLFLWSVRHVVCAAEDRRNVNPLVAQFFNDAGLPRVPGLISALLRTVSATAREGLTVNIPCGAQVTPDEALLLQDLFGPAPHPRQASALKTKLVDGAEIVVGRRLQELAAQFDVLETMRGTREDRAAAVVH
ncbi:MAG: hypothetical protein AB8G16_19320 [Gammaproteobacteria bacterium]